MLLCLFTQITPSNIPPRNIQPEKFFSDPYLNSNKILLETEITIPNPDDFVIVAIENFLSVVDLTFR